MILSDPRLPAFDCDAFLFDCDGTIADSMDVHLRAWQKALAPHGATMTEAQHDGWAGRPTDVIVEIMNQERRLRLPPGEISALKERYYAELSPQVRAVPLIREIIDEYRGRLPFAVVSGSPRHSVIRTLEQLGLTRTFPLIVGAEDTAIGKPAPDPYLKAARGLGVAPEKCLVFEDADLGQQSALAAGMRCARLIRRNGAFELLKAENFRA